MFAGAGVLVLEKVFFVSYNVADGGIPALFSFGMLVYQFDDASSLVMACCLWDPSRLFASQHCTVF
jgi:hypothetical protein